MATSHASLSKEFDGDTCVKSLINCGPVCNSLIVEISVKLKDKKWDEYEEDYQGTNNKNSNCAGDENIRYNSSFCDDF